MSFYINDLLPYLDSDVNGCAEIGVLLLFLSLTEQRAAKLGFQVQPDDEIDAVAALLTRLTKTTRISKEEFADIVARRFASLGGDAELGRAFVLDVPDAGIVAASQIYERHPVEWKEDTRASLRRLCGEAIMHLAKNSYLMQLLPELSQALVNLTKQLGKPEETTLRVCVRWAGLGDLACVLRNAGLDVWTYAPNATAAALASIYIALDSDRLQLGRVGVGTPDDEFDVVLVSEQDYTHASRVYDAMYGAPRSSTDFATNAAAALQNGLPFVREDGGVMIGLTSNRMCYGERTVEMRRNLIERGMDAVCELGKGRRMDTEHQVISVLRSEKGANTPILLASTASEAARKANLDLTTRYTEEGLEEIDLAAIASNIVELVINHTQLDYISLELDRSQILESADSSLRFSSYAASVDVGRALESAESWDELLADAKTKREAVHQQEEKFAQVLDAIDKALG